MGVERTRTTAQATAEGLRVFVAGVPWNISEEVLRRDFEECGVVEDLFLLKDQEGNSRGRCFITFRETDAVQAALKYNDTEYGGRKIYVKIAEEKRGGEVASSAQGHAAVKGNADSSSSAPKRQKPAAKFPEEKPVGCTSVCLKNIGEATEDDVWEFLDGCSVQSVRVVYDRASGAPRGIAFADFSDTSGVDDAMARAGKNLKGRAVEMRYEVPRERPRPDGCLTVAVKKLPPEAMETDVRKLFKGLRSISDVRVICDKMMACTGLAFAEFTEVADVEAAVRRDGMSVLGKTVFICYETKEKKVREGDGPADKKTQQASSSAPAAPKKEETPGQSKKKRKKTTVACDEGAAAAQERVSKTDFPEEQALTQARKKERKQERLKERRKDKARAELETKTPAEDASEAVARGVDETSAPKRSRKKTALQNPVAQTEELIKPKKKKRSDPQGARPEETALDVSQTGEPAKKRKAKRRKLESSCDA